MGSAVESRYFERQAFDKVTAMGSNEFVFSVRQRVLVPLLLLALGGCGKKTKEPVLDLVPMSGTVTLDGNPVADANVLLVYEGSPPVGFAGSGAITDAQGRYEAQTMGKKGTVAGTYQVTVSKLVSPNGETSKPTEGMDLEQLRASGAVKESIPPKYTTPATTDLKVTVEKGKAEGYNFELKSS